MIHRQWNPFDEIPGLENYELPEEYDIEVLERTAALAAKGVDSVACKLRFDTVVLRRDEVNSKEFDLLLENLVDTMLPRECVGKWMWFLSQHFTEGHFFL